MCFMTGLIAAKRGPLPLFSMTFFHQLCNIMQYNVYWAKVKICSSLVHYFRCEIEWLDLWTLKGPADVQNVKKFTQSYWRWDTSHEPFSDFFNLKSLFFLKNVFKSWNCYLILDCDNQKKLLSWALLDQQQKETLHLHVYLATGRSISQWR